MQLKLAPAFSERRPAAPMAARDVWKIVGIVVAGVLAIWFVAKTIDVLLVFFAAIVFAEAIRPLVCFGVRRLGLPRWAATVLVYVTLFVILGLLIWIVLTPLISQVQTLINNSPALLDRWNLQLATLQKNPAGAAFLSFVTPQAQTLGSAAINALLGVPSTAFSILFNVAFTLFLAFYWLNATNGLRDFVVSLFPLRARSLLNGMFDKMGSQLGVYIRSVIINMVAIGTITSIALWALGIPYPLVLGVFAALTEAIPLVGPYIGGLPALLLAFSISPFKALLVIITYVVVQQFESNTLVPVVIGRTMQMNPLVTLLSVLIGTSLYGIVGALLAVPVMAIVQIVFLRLIVPLLRGELHLDDEEHEIEALPAALP
ncbi:MAG: AI-2E family transporter [Ktedonobacterales bacterium]|nr:AI-2E family transporter [Ktedonobacterales bacterium]